jgi:hypothetical protein
MYPAVGFYEKLGFIPLEVNAGELGDRPRPHPMFLELGATPTGAYLVCEEDRICVE